MSTAIQEFGIDQEDKNVKLLPPATNSYKVCSVILCVALVVVTGTFSGITAWLVNRGDSESCVQVVETHPPSGDDMLRLVHNMQAMDYQYGDLQAYYDTFRPSSNVSYTNISYEPDIDSDDVPEYVWPSSEDRRMRQLSLRSIATIGRLIGRAGSFTWNLIQSNTAVRNHAGWVGAVPEELRNDWTQLSGWRTRSVRLLGRDTPDCCSWATGCTSVDWTLTWQYNGNFIQNARILANSRAAMGMSVNVVVHDAGVPTNAGTQSRPVARIPMAIDFSSQGGWAATHKRTMIIHLDARGAARIVSDVGTFC